MSLSHPPAPPDIFSVDEGAAYVCRKIVTISLNYKFICRFDADNKQKKLHLQSGSNVIEGAAAAAVLHTNGLFPEPQTQHFVDEKKKQQQTGKSSSKQF